MTKRRLYFNRCLILATAPFVMPFIFLWDVWDETKDVPAAIWRRWGMEFDGFIRCMKTGDPK